MSPMLPEFAGAAFSIPQVRSRVFPCSKRNSEISYSRLDLGLSWQPHQVCKPIRGVFTCLEYRERYGSSTPSVFTKFCHCDCVFSSTRHQQRESLGQCLRESWPDRLLIVSCLDDCVPGFGRNTLGLPAALFFRFRWQQFLNSRQHLRGRQQPLMSLLMTSLQSPLLGG